MATLAEYRRNWNDAASRHEIRLEHLRKAALKDARKMAGILVKEFGATRIIVFGSILDKEAFDEASDIDIAVEGLRKPAYFTALARLMMSSRFEIDLKPVEDVNGAIKRSIEKGKVLYEKRKNS